MRSPRIITPVVQAVLLEGLVVRAALVGLVAWAVLADLDG